MPGTVDHGLLPGGSMAGGSIKLADGERPSGRPALSQHGCDSVTPSSAASCCLDSAKQRRVGTRGDHKAACAQRQARRSMLMRLLPMRYAVVAVAAAAAMGLAACGG